LRKKTLLLCGATGFIGRNLLERFLAEGAYDIRAAYHRTKPPAALAKRRGVRFFRADLTNPKDVARATRGADVVVQAAATTSGSKDIVNQPSHHVTDNAVMNSLLFRACHEQGVGRVVFFSCTVMYSERPHPVRESDFDYAITPNYFGVGWTKVYLEKMCEFYSRLGRTRYTVLRHSNIYGPHDKYDFEKSHVFGATVAKVMTAQDGRVVVWGEGTEERDLLHVDDLADLVSASLENQKTPFELLNAGSGRSVSVAELVRLIIARSGRRLRIEFDRSKPSIPFKLTVDSTRARELFGWSPKVGLEEGIDRSLAWYREHYRPAKKHAR